MSIPIPIYLEEIAEIKKETKEYIILKVQCKCGCDKFNVFKSERFSSNFNEYLKWKKERDEFWKRIGKTPTYIKRDNKDGKVYEYSTNLFGFKKHRYCTSDRPIILKENSVMVECINCFDKYEIFNNQKYGYDGTFKDIEFKTEEKLNYKKIFYKDNDLFSVLIKIYNDNSLEKFIDAVGEKVSFETYSNAFGSIDIFGIYDNNKVLVYSEETR